MSLTPLYTDAGKQQLNELRYGYEGPIAYTPFAESMNAATADEIRELWLSAIVHHPIAYLEHRLRVFQSFMRFGYKEPYAAHFWEGVLSKRLGQPRKPNVLTSVILRGISISEKVALILFKPYFWLFSGDVFCVLLPGYRGSSEVRVGALLLSISAICYLTPYFLVAPASDFRYAYWAVWAMTMASAMLLLDMIHRRSLGCNKRICLAGVVVFAGLVWTDVFLAHVV